MSIVEAEPEMSVVLVTPDGLGRLQDALASLSAQRAPDRLELVIVTQSLGTLDEADAVLSPFCRVALVELGRFASGASAIAAGVRAASAPIVAYVEEHVYPEPGWAEALIAAHEGPFTAVGCALDNANPASATSWASLFTDFGPWLAQSAAGELAGLPPHQTTYKRAVLLTFGERLEELLEVESMLHRELQAHGHRLYYEPAARVRHLNPSRLRSYTRAEFHGGRTFGSQRVATEDWSLSRRLLYIAASPLIPLVRLRRLLGQLRAYPYPRPRLVVMLPPILVGLFSHTVGECCAYAVGPGNARERRMTFELDRGSHLRRGDR